MSQEIKSQKYKFKKGDTVVFFHYRLTGNKEIDSVLSHYSGCSFMVLKRRKDIYYCQVDDIIAPIPEFNLRANRHPLTNIFKNEISN